METCRYYSCSPRVVQLLDSIYGFTCSMLNPASEFTVSNCKISENFAPSAQPHQKNCGNGPDISNHESENQTVHAQNNQSGNPKYQFYHGNSFQVSMSVLAVNHSQRPGGSNQKLSNQSPSQYQIQISFMFSTCRRSQELHMYARLNNTNCSRPYVATRYQIPNQQLKVTVPQFAGVPIVLGYQTKQWH